MQSTSSLQRAILVVGLALGGSAVAAEVEAKKDGVEVFADATNKSEVLQTLKSGESIKSIERKGMFWQVEVAGGKAGYVSVLAVKHKADVDTGLAKAINSVVKDGRQMDESQEGRARSAVMGVRGLAEDDDAGNAGNVRPNLRAVYKMEDVTVPSKKVEQVGEMVYEEIAKKAGG